MATKQAGWHLLQTHLIRPAERCGATARGNGCGVLQAEAVSFEYPLLSTGIRDSARSALPRTIAGSKGVCVSAGSDGQTVRAARNQSLYREVNERIKELNERFDEASGLGAEWICECLDPECREEMQLSFGEYEQLRTHPNPFVVLPGHVWRKRSSGSSRSTRTMSSWRSSVPARSARLSTIRANPNAPSELGGRLLHRAAELDGAAVRARLQTRRFGCDADLSTSM